MRNLENGVIKQKEKRQIYSRIEESKEKRYRERQKHGETKEGRKRDRGIRKGGKRGEGKQKQKI
jgi:hypothetical protein